MRIIVPVLLVAAALTGAEEVRVAKVHNGHLFEAADGRQVVLIGVENPDVLDAGGDICRDVLEKYLLGRKARLEPDGADRDSLGRLRRYVYVGDTLVNALMVRKGFGHLPEDGTAFRFSDTLGRLQATAARIEKGLWPFDLFPPPSLKTVSADIEKYLVDGDTGDLPGYRVVSWEDADQCYGRLVKVVGYVVATYRSDKVFIMNFHQDYRRHFKVAVFASNLDKFPPNPEDYYRKRLVRVTGSVREYEGAPEMIVDDPAQIEILE